MAIPMFPLSSVLVPATGLPLHIFESRYRRMVADCLAAGSEFGVVLITRGSEVGGGEMRSDVGTLARIVEHEEFDDGRLLVLCVGIQRVRVEHWLQDNPYPQAEVEALQERGEATPAQLGEAEASVRRLRSLLSELGDVPALPHDLVLSEEPLLRTWQLCELAPLNPLDRQQLLVTDDTGARLGRLRSFCAEMTDDVLGLLAGES